MAGRILVAKHDGFYMLKFVGDVRVTLCTAVDAFLETMFDDPEFRSVLVDLSQTAGIDSTSLGILAKLSIRAGERYGFTPTLVSTRPDITRQLVLMGFDDVYHIINNALTEPGQLVELPAGQSDEDQVRRKVLEAHRVLMSMNESNRFAFADLVRALESDQASVPSAAPPPGRHNRSACGRS